MTGRVIARTSGRYLAGLAVVVLLLAGGIVVRTVQEGSRTAEHRADVAVVLGAAQYNGTPSPVYRARLDHALDLFRRGVVDHLMTLGGNQSGDRTTEGAAGRTYLLEQGVPEADVVGVGVGGDTLTSLQAAVPELDEHRWDSALLVTDPAHSFRALTIAHRLGIEATGSPVHTGPATDGDVQLRYYAREVLGSLYFLLIGGSSHAGATVL